MGGGRLRIAACSVGSAQAAFCAAVAFGRDWKQLRTPRQLLELAGGAGILVKLGEAVRDWDPSPAG